jgi:glycerol-3-phosphate O-acyltransferase
LAAVTRFNLTDLSLRLLERVLYWLTRARVFPPSATELELDPRRPVCYVLQYRHLSNLLVLHREAEKLGLPPVFATTPDSRRSFFFLSRHSPRKIFEKAPEKVSPLMRQLVAEVLARPDFDVQMVPVSIYWGRAPGRQNSILKALLAETWRATGTLRQTLAILMHGRHAVVRFSKPLSLRELLATVHEPQRGERKLARLLRVHFRRERERMIGPDLSHRHTLVRTLLGSARVQAAIREEAEQKLVSPLAARGSAQRIALEIAADYSHTAIRALELFLDWLWTRLYDGIELHGFERVTAIPPGHGIVYVPCHRSHIDYLLLSFVVFRQGLMPPHIAAGANLNIPLVGPLLRRGGAFFLRRSFKGDALYASIFVEYLQSILHRGFPIEYFIEGGRSRNGRTLPPKAGILGMTLQGFAANPVRPLVFVPVYVGYEKVMEGRSYLAELGGQGKRTESLGGLLATVKRLRREFGKVYVNFGEPLDATTILDTRCPGWQTHAADMPHALRPAIEQAAITLVTRINGAAVLNPINLFALALPETRQHVDALKRRISHLQRLHAHAAYPGVSLGTPLTPDAIIAAALRLGFAHREADPHGDMIRVDTEQAALLAYFRNNVVHLFALTSLIAWLLSQHRELSAAAIASAVAEHYPQLRTELFLPWELQELPAATASAAQALIHCTLIEFDPAQAIWRAPDAGSQGSEELIRLGELVRPLLIAGEKPTA